MRLLKVVAILAILLLGGLAGYAYFGDMDADPAETRMPVALDLGAPTPDTSNAPQDQGQAAPQPETGQDGLD